MPAGDQQGPRPDLTPSLVVRLRAGEATAGGLLNDLYREPMLRFCWGYLGNEQDAEDAVQEVFCNVLRTGGVPENFRAWLYKIARRHCLNVLRGYARRRDASPLPSDSRLGADQTGNLTRLVRREQRSRVAHLVEALPADQREVLRMRYVEKLPRAEIAYVLDLPESVVKSRLFEGSKKLRDHTSLLDEE
jgi:RNA polymerase sigma-70 factor (ECF subfamily)